MFVYERSISSATSLIKNVFCIKSDGISYNFLLYLRHKEVDIMTLS